MEWEPGRAITTRISLTPAGDPVAENHTLGGRRVSALQPELKGLPVVPFAVMAEMVAQVGALLVPSGLVLESLDEVRAHRWVPYEEAGWLELRGVCDPAEPSSVRVMSAPSRGGFRGGGLRRDVSCSRESPGSPSGAPDPPPAGPLRLSRPRQSRFTARGLYDEQWLFHGPPMQALAEVGPVSPDGITGSIAVLPLAPLVRPGAIARFHTDPIVLDTFTHLLGCWGLDCLEGGDVIFPLRMGRLSIHGDPPPEGTRVDCRIRVLEVEHHRVRVDAEIVRPDGRVWMRIGDWEDWRFHWPSRYRDVFRAPDTIFVGEELPLPGCPPPRRVAVWLAPPGDMGRPVWRDVLECTQLGPEEQVGLPRPRTDPRSAAPTGSGDGSRPRRPPGGSGRRPDIPLASPPTWPSITIRTADPGSSTGPGPTIADLPAVSIAHAEGLTVALAARGAGSGPGSTSRRCSIRPSRRKAPASPRASRLS